MAHLKAAELDELGRKHKRVIALDWNEHQIVLRQASRDNVRNYRARESGADAADRVDQLTQEIIVAFDGETDPVLCRERYHSFLEYEGMAWTSSPKCMWAISKLTGVVEEHVADEWGKGASAYPPFRKISHTDLPTGSDGSSEHPKPAANSLRMGA